MQVKKYTTLMEQYEQYIEDHSISDDPLQRQIINQLQNVLSAQESTWLTKLLSKKHTAIGMYIYGPVGVGKTFLMDLFYNFSHEVKKARFHFHHFIQYIDAQLRELQGNPNPMHIIANKLVQQVRILCLDEFFVKDLADAMILQELLHILLNKGVVLVATSNVPVDSLYQDGLHREQFLPTIDLLKEHCQICPLTGERHYRVGRHVSTKMYFSHASEDNINQFNVEFNQCAGEILDLKTLNIQNRAVKVEKCGEHAVWFKFDEICNVPRCSLDYLELSNRYPIIFVSDIPVLTPDDLVAVTLFMHFIDIMYDRKIKLILFAAGPISGLYPEGPLLNEFQRTLSRLEEMQSFDYNLCKTPK